MCLVGLEAGSQEKGQRSWVELWPVEGKGGAERYRVSNRESEVSTVKTRSRKNRMLKSPGKRLQGMRSRERDAQPSSGVRWSLCGRTLLRSDPPGINQPWGQREEKQAERDLLRLEVLLCLKPNPGDQRRARRWLGWAQFCKAACDLPAYVCFAPPSAAGKGVEKPEPCATRGRAD